MGQSYRDLKAWQKAMDLVVAIYEATEDFPNKRCMASRARSGERLFRFLATSQKGRGGDCLAIFSTFYETPGALCSNWKRRFYWRRGLSIWMERRRMDCWRARPKLAESSTGCSRLSGQADN